MAEDRTSYRQVNVLLTEDLWARVRKYSASTGLKIRAIAQKAFEDYLSRVAKPGKQ